MSIEGGAGGRGWVKMKTALGTNGPKAVPKYSLERLIANVVQLVKS